MCKYQPAVGITHACSFMCFTLNSKVHDDLYPLDLPPSSKTGFYCRPDGAWLVVMVKNCVSNETAIPLSPYWPQLDTKRLSVRTYVCTLELRYYAHMH